MTATVQPWEDDDALSQRAADFFERRRFGDWSNTDQAALDAWLAESILHEVAYLRVEGIAAHTEELAALRPFNSGHAERSGEGIVIRRWIAFPLLAAASIALIATVGWPLVQSYFQTPDRIFSTDVGGRTLVRFADGTEIELNTDTAMRFRMTTAERTVWLNKGEAWFRVAHNAANPFNVIIGKHRVTDLGTEFAVRRDADDVEVALLNGRAMLNTDGTPTTMLTPGDDAVATPMTVSVTRKTPRELADELAWRSGMLEFHNMRFADAVQEFNRYNAVKLVITDPSIAGIRFSAEAKTNDYDGFLRLAQSVLKLRIDRVGNEILISRAQGERTKKAVRIKHEQ